MTAPNTATLQGSVERQQRAQDFVRQVLEVCAGSKRAQADLRSGLGLPYDRCQRMHRHLMRLVPERNRHPEARRPYYVVAALIAARSRGVRDEDAERNSAAPAQGDASPSEPGGTAQSWWQRPNLGASLAEAVNLGALAAGSAESELHLLARVGSESLHSRLPALVGQVNGRGVVLDWAVLLDDLAGWDYSQDRIATRWLESYFRVRDAAERAAERGQAEPPAADGHSKDSKDSNDAFSEENQ
ncbi:MULTISPECIES: type I-E CRISPR-associated protein Cse2/CasB [unclassified Streptomyces]|uniref:type I-E CRISPR-associated protein Cse2/CasB n=1 Tax=unclassified Streptomyces TaxID=2593676 RepID=UPI002E2B4A8B|nr:MULTISPECIES: type I-E CRISPR-associated protein Cse2/CasB [unclassified Streptomyces]